MTPEERRKLENKMMVMGLTNMSDPNLIKQLAVLISDHEFLSGMLGACDVEKRREMYEALKPYLRFQAFPLEHYMDRIKEKAGNIASREKAIEVGDKVFQEVTQDQSTGVVVGLTCFKCTGFQEFYGETIVEAVISARENGWVRDVVRGAEICPKCPAFRSHNGNIEISAVVN